VPVSGPRLILDALPAPGELVRIPLEEAAHARARRLDEGSTVVLIDGSGREAVARIVRMRRGGCEVRVESVADRRPAAAAPLHLFVAAVRAERLGWIAEKASELGAARLTVVATERTQAFRARDGVLARLQRLARESAKQSGSPTFTAVDGPVSFASALSADAEARLLLDPSGQAFPASLASAPAALLVGPEGGFTDAERRDAREAGWVAVALPAGVVRAETAAVAALILARAAILRKS
jgi:16S rRNA (uracil1498-N3)-methyltransferase